MSDKSYRQACWLAVTLDHVGQRWTLLIVRDLLGGPARFKELERSLPGISPNLLTARLRELETAGVLERSEDGGGAVVYRLSKRGEQLRPAMEALGTLGMVLGAPPPEATVQPKDLRGMAFGLEATLKQGLPSKRNGTIKLIVGEQPLRVSISPTEVTVRAESAGTPTSTIAVGYALLRDLLVYDAPLSRLRSEARVVEGRAGLEVLARLWAQARRAPRPTSLS